MKKNNNENTLVSNQRIDLDLDHTKLNSDNFDDKCELKNALKNRCSSPCVYLNYPPHNEDGDKEHKLRSFNHDSIIPTSECEEQKIENSIIQKHLEVKKSYREFMKQSLKLGPTRRKTLSFSTLMPAKIEVTIKIISDKNVRNK